MMLGLWPLVAHGGSVVHQEVDAHLQCIENHIEILTTLMVDQALEVELLSTGSMPPEDWNKRQQRSEEKMDLAVQRIAALSTEIPRLDVGYTKLFFKQPIRVAGGGMLFTPALIPYNDTAETVGAHKFHVGMGYATSVGRKVAPLQYNAKDLFVDVNDFGFTGFGDVKFLSAVSGTWVRVDVNGVVGLTNWFDVGARFPFYQSPEFALYDAQLYQNYTTQLNQNMTAGDIELWAKWRVYSLPGNYLRMAVRADMRYPTGDIEAGNSFGIEQYGLSYIVSVEPTYNFTANWTTGATLLQGRTPIFARYVPLTSVVFTGLSGSYRVSDSFSLFGQVDTHTSPYAELEKVEVDILSAPSSIFTFGTKVDSRVGLFDVGFSKGLTRSAPDYGVFINLVSKNQFE